MHIWSFSSHPFLIQFHNRHVPFDPRRVCLSLHIGLAALRCGPVLILSVSLRHHQVYAPGQRVGARDYGVARYGMEVQRLCDTLDQHLEGRQFICDDEYTIADMICLPWFHVIRDRGPT